MSDVSKNVSLRAYQVQGALKPHALIRNVVAVASGKGGVGKSTTALNLALILSQQGFQVGLLDADIQGPSIPKLLGQEGVRLPPPVSEDAAALLKPLEIFGLKALSFAYLLPRSDQPVIWRGPMMSSALTQLFFQASWGALDVLVIDLPPGTGDILLTLAQKIPVTAAILVTTPSDVAIIDVVKAYRMFEKFGIFVAGLVNNMSHHRCSACGHEEALWGTGAPEKMAEALDIPILGALPLLTESELGLSPDSVSYALYDRIQAALLARIQSRPISYANHFPNIVVES